MSRKISLIICTYNREKFIAACLESCYNQSLPKSDYEVLIINNKCTDNTTSIVDLFIKNHPSLNCRQIVESQQGLSFARNRGIGESASQILTFIDDDGIADFNLLAYIVDQFSEFPEYAGIGGKVNPIYETQEPEWYSPYLRMMVTAIDFGEHKFKCLGKKYPAGCNMSYRKKYLIEAGGFNNELKWRTDDKYIFQAVSRINDNIYYIPTIEVQHHIDAARITDANFEKLSKMLGSEEKIRILSINKWLYPAKLLEYLFKYIASFLIAIGYSLKCKAVKGKYIIKFRWYALKGIID